VPEAIIDTNCFIYYLVEDSDKHTEALSTLESLDAWLIPPIVVYELVWFFKALNADGGVVASLLDHAKANIVVEDGKASKIALSYILKQRLSLGYFNDMVIINTAKRFNKPLYTYDKKMRHRAEKLGVMLIFE